MLACSRVSYLSTGRWPRQAGIPTSLSSCAPAIGRRVPKHLFSLSIIRGSVAGVRGGSRTQRRQAFAPNRRTRGPALAWARGAALHMSWTSDATNLLEHLRTSIRPSTRLSTPCSHACHGRRRAWACRPSSTLPKLACTTSSTRTSASRMSHRRRSSCGAKVRVKFVNRALKRAARAVFR